MEQCHWNSKLFTVYENEAAVNLFYTYLLIDSLPPVITVGNEKCSMLLEWLLCEAVKSWRSLSSVSYQSLHLSGQACIWTVWNHIESGGHNDASSSYSTVSRGKKGRLIVLQRKLRWDRKSCRGKNADPHFFFLFCTVQWDNNSRPNLTI